MKRYIFLILVSMLLLSACSGGGTTTNEITGDSSASVEELESDQVSSDDTNSQSAGTDNTADEDDDGDGSAPTDTDYATVFPQDEVNEIVLTISSENWEAMLADMETIYGTQGQGNGRGDQAQINDGESAPDRGGPGGAGGEPPADGDMPEMPEGDFQPGEGGQGGPAGNGQGGGGMAGGGIMLEDDDVNPIWVPVTVSFDGQTWDYVGMRFKGNSSLRSGWQSGTLKLPFKLDFDEFEDDYPETEDQRFYNFKQISFSSNYNDVSQLREKVAADIFQEAGVTAAETAFYAVYLDYGEGQVYMGLYTAVEVIDDTVIETQFSDGSGNAYKPSGNAATFAAGTYEEESFDKETNKDEADYSDVAALYEVINSETRTSDPEQWKADLETVFNVDGFLRYLAVNNTIQNWDTYGSMAHNYYLYTDPATSLINWIPWDNNMALPVTGDSTRIGAGGNVAAPAGQAEGDMAAQGGGRMNNMGGGKMGNTLSFSMEEVGDDWPLIRYIMDVDEYRETYDAYVEMVVTSVFTPENMEPMYSSYASLISPYVTQEGGDTTAFNNAITALIQTVSERQAAAWEYLGGE